MLMVSVPRWQVIHDDTGRRLPGQVDMDAYSFFQTQGPSSGRRKTGPSGGGGGGDGSNTKKNKKRKRPHKCCFICGDFLSEKVGEGLKTTSYCFLITASESSELRSPRSHRMRRDAYTQPHDSGEHTSLM